MSADQFLLELYKEEQTHARHTETQRLEVTKFLLIVVGVLVAFMGTLKFSVYCLPFGFLIVALGYIGRTITSTYVQRFDDHRKRARAFRNELDEMVTPAGTAAPVLQKHPMTKPNDDRVRTFWQTLNKGVILLGVICILCNVLAIVTRVSTDCSSASVTQKLFKQLSLIDK